VRRGKRHGPAAPPVHCGERRGKRCGPAAGARTGCAPGALEDRGRAPFPSSWSRMSEAKDSGSRGSPADPRPVQTSMPSWTLMGQERWAQARMIWTARWGARL